MEEVCCTRSSSRSNVDLLLRNDVEILIMDWMNILALAHQWNFKKVR